MGWGETFWPNLRITIKVLNASTKNGSMKGKYLACERLGRWGCSTICMRIFCMIGTTAVVIIDHANFFELSICFPSR